MPSRRNDPREWSPVSLVPQTAKDKIKGRLQQSWEYILANPANYPAEIFAQVAFSLVLHPERNSKNIRRADILSDTDTDPEIQEHVAENVKGMVCSRTIRRRLMPRNPNLDPELEQTCRFYIEEGNSWPTLVTYHCHYVESVGVPYYVPDVLGVAFELYEGDLYLAYLPLQGISCNDERLQRVALNLLRTIHRHWYLSYILS
jgi:tRNASer (uridine44-2'-O)-methyltransferase